MSAFSVLLDFLLLECLLVSSLLFTNLCLLRACTSLYLDLMVVMASKVFHNSNSMVCSRVLVKLFSDSLKK
jgi:hypothetical protein